MFGHCMLVPIASQESWGAGARRWGLSSPAFLLWMQSGKGRSAASGGATKGCPICSDPQPTILCCFSPCTPRLSVRSQRGFTLLELIIATAIVVVLSTMAVPLARLAIKREKERQLRIDLWEMRDAIDRYKDLADRGGFRTKVDSQNYPADLETLVKGEDVQGKKIRFLRKIPIDPLTGTKEWGLRSMQDDPDSDSWGGQSVFDVYTKSQGTALDGTKYKDW
jgi:general secretion pathway protein G